MSHLVCTLDYYVRCSISYLFAFKSVSGKVLNLLRKHVHLGSLRRPGHWETYGRRFWAEILCFCSSQILH
uniref:Uncharacterized protein n=1 Tax=Triticum urartu TaxID=4572 RepID=A0A8R7K273_TRIUA